MKKNYSFLVIISVLLLLITSCSKDEEINQRTGEPFSRAPNMRIYYSDAENVDLLDLTNNQILPITFENTVRIPDVLPIDSTISFQYNGGLIKLNTVNDKYYWRTYITGKTGYENQTIYVRISETDIDTLTVKYRFANLIINNQPAIYPHIERLQYNGILIRGDEGTSAEFTPLDIFITKNNGKSTISFEE